MSTENMGAYKIAVIGSGMMGRGIAACCASGGSEVALYDTNAQQLSQGETAANELFAFLRQAGLSKGQGSIRAVGDLKRAVQGCAIVFEAVVEDVAVKTRVLREVETHVGAACVLATNTSSLSVSAIAAGLATPSRFAAAHFIGPAHLVPLVELCPAVQTGPGVVERLRAYLAHIGKKPVVLDKEIQGFIAARLQAALYRESMHLVVSGVASPETVDDAVTNGFGRRLNQIGPFTVADFAGVDLVQKTHGTFFPQLGAYQTDERSTRLVKEGRRGVKSGGGNYDWQPQQAKEVAARRDAELLRRLKEDFAETRSKL